MAAPNSPYRWLLKWRLNRNIRHYVELATADCRIFLDREPVTFRAALGEVGRWVVDYIKGRQPISWPERRYFVGAFRGFTPTKTAHERAFAEWLHSCWLADQYPNTNISVSHQSLFSPELRARCAERETELLNQFLAVVPAYNDLQWSERHISEDEDQYRAYLTDELSLRTLETEWKLEAEGHRSREADFSEEIEFDADGFVQEDDISYDTDDFGRDDYEDGVDRYIKMTHGLH